MYFIEECHLYTKVGSSGKGVRISEKGAIGALKRFMSEGHLEKDTYGHCDWWQLSERIAL